MSHGKKIWLFSINIALIQSFKRKIKNKDKDKE